MWFVYIVECADETFYTGITKDLKRRIEEHNSSVFGAKYTRGRRPVKLVFSKKTKNKSEALKEELQIKKISKQKKLMLIKKRKK